LDNVGGKRCRTIECDPMSPGGERFVHAPEHHNARGKGQGGDGSHSEWHPDHVREHTR